MRSRGASRRGGLRRQNEYRALVSTSRVAAISNPRARTELEQAREQALRLPRRHGGDDLEAVRLVRQQVAHVLHARGVDKHRARHAVVPQLLQRVDDARGRVVRVVVQRRAVVNLPRQPHDVEGDVRAALLRDPATASATSAQASGSGAWARTPLHHPNAASVHVSVGGWHRVAATLVWPCAAVRVVRVPLRGKARPLSATACSQRHATRRPGGSLAIGARVASGAGVG